MTSHDAFRKASTAPLILDSAEVETLVRLFRFGPSVRRRIILQLQPMACLDIVRRNAYRRSHVLQTIQAQLDASDPRHSEIQKTLNSETKPIALRPRTRRSKQQGAFTSWGNIPNLVTTHEVANLLCVSSDTARTVLAHHGITEINPNGRPLKFKTELILKMIGLQVTVRGQYRPPASPRPVNQPRPPAVTAPTPVSSLPVAAVLKMDPNIVGNHPNAPLVDLVRMHLDQGLGSLVKV